MAQFKYFYYALGIAKILIIFELNTSGPIQMHLLLLTFFSFQWNGHKNLFKTLNSGKGLEATLPKFVVH